MDVALWNDLSSLNLCGSSCGIPQKEGSRARGAETLQHRHDAAWAKRELPLRSEWHWVNAISLLSYTISTAIFYDITFNIERVIDLRYRIQYQHTISINVFSI